MDISGVDFPEREKRFEVAYHLLSIKHQGRIRVKTYAGEADHVPSACELFRGADWYVRIQQEYPTILTLLIGTREKPGTCMGSSSMATLTCMYNTVLIILPFSDTFTVEEF